MDTTATATHNASEAHLPPPMRALVNIFLQVWEVAMLSRRMGLPVQGTVRNVTRLRPGVFPDGVTMWEFEEDLAVKVTGFDDDDDRGDPDDKALWVEGANRKLNMCGFFCYFAEDMLRQKLEELELGTVRQVNFLPLPNVVFVPMLPSPEDVEAHLSADELGRLKGIMHAVLEITTTAGDKLILDGTPDQYDWHNEGWLIPKATAERDLLLGPWVTPMEEELAAMEEVLAAPVFEDFRVLFDRARDLFKGLEWERLMALEDEEEMCAEVAEEARRMFRDVFS